MTNRTDAIKLAIEALEDAQRSFAPAIHSGISAALAALQTPNWSDIGRLIEAANGAAARGFISGTSNLAAFVSRAMGGQAREGEAVAPSAILARGRFHTFKGEDGEPDDWEWFEEGTNCEHGCIDAVIVRADAIAAPQPAQPSEPAQPVAQPNIQNQIVKDISRHEPCHTCAHYQQGKLPGVRIHDETCYECRSYWGNKWEAA